jgi:peptidoglycan/LPS O-acetylase OafA/YrhL
MIKGKKRFAWVDFLKGMALLGILLNHFVEEFSKPFGLSFPVSDWQSFSFQNQNLLKTGQSLLWLFTRFMAWVGDHGPGVFILLSGFALTYSAFSGKHQKGLLWFYNKRLLRIYPLYIIIHFIVLLGVLIVFGREVNWGRNHVFLSILGLRASDSLFFLFNPSWWFIWLILQLYLIFPFLLWLLRKTDTLKFLIITLAFTVVCGLLGLMGFRYSGSQYNWLTGIFFGTRLAEFSAGMGLGALLWNNKSLEKQGHNSRIIVILAFALFFIGTVFTLNRYSAVLSNFFITVGLSGVLYSVFSSLKSHKQNRLVNSIGWIGVYSYGIYLVHQAPLQWTSHYFSGGTHLFTAVLVILFSFPLGWVLEKKTNLLQKKLSIPGSREKNLRFLLYVTNGFVFLAFFFVEPKISDLVKRTVFDLILIFSFFVSTSLYLKLRKSFERNRVHFVQYAVWTLFVSAFIVFPAQLGDLVVVLVLMLLILNVFFNRFFQNRIVSYGIATGIVFLSFVIIEMMLKIVIPVETDRWGEFEALQVHPTRIYGLIPEKESHLKYNNYDYVLQTNSLGLTSPEIAIKRPLPETYRIMVVGDAFSMPEGVEYGFSYPALLESNLKKRYPHKNIQIINGGVTGYGPVEESVQLDELGSLFKPNLVIYQFFINEFSQALEENRSVRTEGIGFSNDSFSLTKYLQKYSQLVTRFRRLRNQVLTIFGKSNSMAGYGKSLLIYYEKDNRQLYSKTNLGKLKKYLKQMKLSCEKNGSDFLIVFVPGQVAVSEEKDIAFFPKNIHIEDTTKFDMDEPYRILDQICDSMSIPVTDLTEHLRTYPYQPVYFRESWHWNKNGHKAVADYLTLLLDKNGYLDKDTNIILNK